MAERHSSQSDDVDSLILNARLREELEPFYDESISRLEESRISTEQENAYLASILAWEKAPVLAIRKWFEPELALVPAQELSDEELHARLWEVIHALFARGVVLDFTEHLSDRDLYRLICRDILPAEEKKIDGRNGYLHWDCSDLEDNPEVWLQYYATDAERAEWYSLHLRPLPLKEQPPYPRHMPRPGKNKE